MRSDLAEDPAVIGIARRVGLDVDAVVGKLHRVWSMADRQSADGHLPELTLVSIDECARFEKFGAAMVAVGWLIEHKTGLELPNFERHNGKSAKRRALNAIYQDSARSAKRQHGTLTKRSPDKRREEIPSVVSQTDASFERLQAPSKAVAENGQAPRPNAEVQRLRQLENICAGSNERGRT